MGACAGLTRQAWRSFVPVPNAHSGLGRNVQELRADPVPGASGEEYTYREWDFRLMDER